MSYFMVAKVRRKGLTRSRRHVVDGDCAPRLLCQAGHALFTMAAQQAQASGQYRAGPCPE